MTSTSADFIKLNSEQSTDKLEWVQSHKVDPGRISFLELPRELRELVYDHALRVLGAIYIYSKDTSPVHPAVRAKIVKHNNEGPSEPQPIGSTIPIALLASCRQLHAECSEIVYGSNVFRTYMSDPGFANTYEPLVRYMVFEVNADNRIYKRDMDSVAWGWRRQFWPHITEKSTVVLQRFPNLESLTFPIKSNSLVQTWKPAFMGSDQKTREQRIVQAAYWMKSMCPIGKEQLRDCLHLEIVPARGFGKEETENDNGKKLLWDFDWDECEFAEAFERMKIL
ncbi:hypothetical protein BDV96DRAFT_496865 [Lophiotrema nucula]|uniref:F-box domain-containing protein n=1 Tax=Lophiotrema nucula TaxID=690887 RepID=A0A6A5Z3Y7_9PLEO|nr:hypothetical protein BDV96DRAFT_496865 [Lophiotrema nucula]